jgi:hypothetical protein
MSDIGHCPLSINEVTITMSHSLASSLSPGKEHSNDIQQVLVTGPNTHDG